MFTPNQITVTDLTSLNNSAVDGKHHNDIISHIVKINDRGLKTLEYRCMDL